MKIVTKLNNVIDNGLVKVIFTHIRNYLMCMTIITAGFFALKSQYKLLPGLLADEFTAGTVITIGIMLVLLNLYDGIYKLSKIRLHIIFDILLVAAYVIITIRIFELILHFRSAVQTGGA